MLNTPAAPVQAMVLDWYRRRGRDLPWRRTRDPYAVLISEVMLQQTRVDRVVPRWREWLSRFPTLASLAHASRADVIRAWSGLGYNRRAVRLHEMAGEVVARHDGRLPASREALLELAGLGRYTSSALACFAFGEQVPVVDTNVRRVLARVFLGEPSGGAVSARSIERVAAEVLPARQAFDWNQALMDLGATICTAARPNCLACPIVSACRAAPSMPAWQTERTHGLRERRAAYRVSGLPTVEPTRLLRGRVVRVLSHGADGPISFTDLQERLSSTGGASLDAGRLEQALLGLAADGLAHLEQLPQGLFARLP